MNNCTIGFDDFNVSIIQKINEFASVGELIFRSVLNKTFRKVNNFILMQRQFFVISDHRNFKLTKLLHVLCNTLLLIITINDDGVYPVESLMEQLAEIKCIKIQIIYIVKYIYIDVWLNDNGEQYGKVANAIVLEKSNLKSFLVWLNEFCEPLYTFNIDLNMIIKPELLKLRKLNFLKYLIMEYQLVAVSDVLYNSIQFFCPNLLDFVYNHNDLKRKLVSKKSIGMLYNCCKCIEIINLAGWELSVDLCDLINGIVRKNVNIKYVRIKNNRMLSVENAKKYIKQINY